MSGHTTRRVPKSRKVAKDAIVPCLTILAHPMPSRIGDRALLANITSKEGIELSRLQPLFSAPSDVKGEPLNDPFISRKPLLLTKARNGGVTLTPREDGSSIAVNGTTLDGPMTLSGQDVAAGAVLQVADRVTLFLHGATLRERHPYRYGLVGESDLLEDLIQSITQVADLNVPVLLLGPSGAGKELVAKALHEGGPRRDKPYVCVNMGAIPPTTANSEVFGHVKGSFTGASRDHNGYFVQADSGTLFLDEIGESSTELQVMLLRTLETGEVQPLGGSRGTSVDVRLVTATDRDLPVLCESGGFREPLYHRIATYQIHVPSLYDRREDLGRLFLHFLRQELEQIGGSERLDASDDEMLVPASLMAALALYPWPGNVRQLRNVVRQLVISSRGKSTLALDAALERLLSTEVDTPAGPAIESGYRKPDDVSEEEVILCLRENAFRINPTAKSLGLSRTSLYAIIDRSDKIRKAADLAREDVESAIQSCDGNLDEMSSMLEVSKRGLVFRMKELGLT